MNDALTSGARAFSSWSVGDFQKDSQTATYAFTADHHITVFESVQFGSDPAQVTETTSCMGPFHVAAPAICGAYDPDHSGNLIAVNALATAGCP
ncbi:hypothetical protein BH11MYX1_BH11MYX1_39550 [soil metagenome]